MSGTPAMVVEEPPADPCGSCTQGRMGTWTAVRAGTAPVMVGELALAGRVCDRCRSVEFRSHRPAPASPRAAAPGRRHSSGGELLDGFVRNLRAALGELWRSLSCRPRSGRGGQ